MNLQPIKKTPIGLEPEYEAPFNAWKAGANPETTAGILKALQPAMDQGIRLFTGQAQPSPNLRSRARQTTLQALGTYQPAKGGLKTHVVNAMQGMRRINRNEQNPITVPDRAYLDNIQLRHASADLEYNLGREPSDQELADRTGFSLRRISKVRQMVRPAVPSSFFEQQDDGESDGGFMPSVVTPQTHEVLHAAVYDELDPIGQKIFEWTIGYNGQPRLTNQQVARRLGLSPSAVTQRKSRIQRRMEELMRYNL